MLIFFVTEATNNRAPPLGLPGLSTRHGGVSGATLCMLVIGVKPDHRGMMEFVGDSLFNDFSVHKVRCFPTASPGDGVQASPGAAFGG